jgi:hypothetical protein
MAKKLNRRNLTAFIRQWIKDEVKNWNNFEHMLEQGFCADLASSIDHCFGSAWLTQDNVGMIVIHNCGNPVHTWIEFDGLHYDLQNPEGVGSWQRLKYFNDCPHAVIED